MCINRALAAPGLRSNSFRHFSISHFYFPVPVFVSTRSNPASTDDHVQQGRVGLVSAFFVKTWITRGHATTVTFAHALCATINIQNGMYYNSSG